MNFFETNLRKIFDNVEGIENTKYIGRTCIADIGGGKVMKASFVQTGIIGGRKNAESTYQLFVHDNLYDSHKINLVQFE